MSEARANASGGVLSLERTVTVSFVDTIGAEGEHFGDDERLGDAEASSAAASLTGD